VSNAGLFHERENGHEEGCGNRRESNHDGPCGRSGEIYRPADAEALGQKDAGVFLVEVKDAELPMFVVIRQKLIAGLHSLEDA